MQLLDDEDEDDNQEQYQPGQGIALSKLGQEQIGSGLGGDKKVGEQEDQSPAGRDRLYSMDIFAEIDEQVLDERPTRAAIKKDLVVPPKQPNSLPKFQKVQKQNSKTS